MAQRAVQLDRENFFCPICLDLLNDPTTIPCGHNYCICCIETHFDGEDEQRLHSCPQCRQTFSSRPALVINTMLAALVDQIKKSDFQAAPGDAGPNDVACDDCTERKRKAVKSCSVCRRSYCEKHLQLYHEAPAFRKHTLVEPTKNLLENTCYHHGEVMKMCTDHQYSIEDREKEVKMLRREVEAINRSADEAVEDSAEIFAELICLMGKLRSDVKQQVRARQKAEVNRVKELQEEFEQEIAEVDNGFVENIIFPPLIDSSDSSRLEDHPRRYFEEVPAAVLEVRDRLQEVLRDTWTQKTTTED